MTLRPAAPEDLSRVLEIYDAARRLMRERGNPDQWGDAYPPESLVRRDIEEGRLCLLTQEGKILACAAFCPGPDPTYAVIDGAWRNDRPYLAIHRVASDGTCRGVFRAFADLAKETFDSVRVDTHEKNLAMQRAVLREGFSFCGVIRTETGSPRLAYQWTK